MDGFKLYQPTIRMSTLNHSKIMSLVNSFDVVRNPRFRGGLMLSGANL
jgi:hypothetical protein